MERRENISRSNYEVFFIDYLEGNLSEEEIRSLEDFLLSNPDLRSELEGLETVILTPGDEKLENPENLKYPDLSTPVTDANFPFFCIAENEGDLNPEMQQELYKYLRANPGKQKERLQFSKLYLVPDPAIHFPEKHKLKKGLFIRYRREWVTGLSIAASIALLLVFFFTFVDRGLDPVVLGGNDSETEVADSLSAGKNTATEEERLVPVKKEDVDPEKPAKPDQKKDIELKEKIIEPVKRASTQISIKVGIPIASNDSGSKAPTLNPEEILSAVRIDASSFPDFFLKREEAEVPQMFNNYKFIPQPDMVDEQRFLTLEEFAKNQFSSIILRQEEDSEINGWTLASAGVKQINSIAGTNLKLEKNLDPEGKVKRITFESRLLSFSAPVNRKEEQP